MDYISKETCKVRTLILDIVDTKLHKKDLSGAAARTLFERKKRARNIYITKRWVAWKKLKPNEH